MKPALQPQAFVFVHRGLPSYLMCSLHQAHLASPKMRMILVSDINPKLPFVEWVDLNSLSSSWEKMAAVYVHLSTNPEPFERFCFYRWFAIRALMRTKNLTRIIHLDSDVMVYFDPASEVVELGRHDFALGSTGSHSGHFAIINSLSVIDEICNVMVELYNNSATLDELKEHFERQAPRGGGVCDMYALGWIVWRRRLRCFELNVIRDYGVFDQALRDSRVAGSQIVWQMQNGMKKVNWKACHPYFQTIDGEDVRALTIHFQGDCKPLMRSSITATSIVFLRKFYLIRLRERTGKGIDYMNARVRHYRRGALKRWRKAFSLTHLN